MFLLDDGTVVYSASDLANAAACEFAVLRSLDAKLGRIEPLELAADAMLERAARLGDRHEERVLDEYVARFGAWDPATGRGVAQIERPERGEHTDRTVLQAKHTETIAVLRTGADVVFQAGFFDGRFGGWADFLVREPGLAADGRRPDPTADSRSTSRTAGHVYSVHDTKLARHAKVTALLQVAAYADQLMVAGVPVSDRVHLVLGDRTMSSHRLADLLPVYLDRRRRLQTMLDERADAGTALGWGEGPYRACGRCDVCAPEIEARRDVLLVAGMRSTQRVRLQAAGITTVEELAASDGKVPGVGEGALERLRAQARLQSLQHLQGNVPVQNGDTAPGHDHSDRHDDGDRYDDGDRHDNDRYDGRGAIPFELFAPEAVGALPPPAPGDIFFDFEGDPLWAEDGSADWGLEYLFGVVEQPEHPHDPPVFRPFWAHDRAQERQALIDFLAYLTERRVRYPHMHVYHYAPYERTALLRLAGRHGVGEEAVDDLLRDGVLVDLYATVRASLRTGQDSYSLKKLEPLYMDDTRAGDVTTAGDSIVEYAEACGLRDDGDLDGWEARLRSIAEYNEYDCVSTLRLRDWLLDRAAEHGVLPRGGIDGSGGGLGERGSGEAGGGDAGDEDGAAPEHDDLATTLMAYADADGTGPRDPDRQAVAMLAASLGYHWREEKPTWWAHFDRLVSDPEEWVDARSVLVAEPGSAEVIEPWHVPPRARTPRRVLRMAGTLEPGSDLSVGSQVFLLYDPPTPSAAITPQEGYRGWSSNVTVLAVDSQAHDGEARDVLLVEERLGSGQHQHGALPMAVVPGRPPLTKGLADAIRAVASEVAAALPEPELSPGHESSTVDLLHQPAIDLLRRRPPRTTGGGPLPVPDGPGGYVEAMTSALLELDGSYLAVQGPPGTGKTYTGAHVIARLVERGWSVGVVAQSHAVVENMFTAVAAAGVTPDRLGKKPADSGTRGGASRARVTPSGSTVPQHPWTTLHPTRFNDFYSAQSGGYVVGGTVWDFTNTRRLPVVPLDLLVIDEAGQFALANTVAVSGAARNLLLLGDPQQLPQVSQGRHPEPVQDSALGWLTDGRDTLPDELGYFLDRSWRMHPTLCSAVSHLSYEDRLTSMPHTAERSLDGVEPGVHTVLVEHQGNAVSSAEEAAAVVAQVRDVVGRRWRDPHAGTDRPLGPRDVLVVAAYNAQVTTVRDALRDAGLGAVEVGTVDKFQGRQAPVVIVTTAASSAEDVPRGMEFLLNRNRVNVAVSRGQWCAVIVRSTRLTDYLPGHPERLAELGAFLGLAVNTGPGRHPGPRGEPVSP